MCEVYSCLPLPSTLAQGVGILAEQDDSDPEQDIREYPLDLSIRAAPPSTSTVGTSSGSGPVSGDSRMTSSEPHLNIGDVIASRIGRGFRRGQPKRNIDSLRLILSSPQLTEKAKARALNIGVDLVEEIYPLDTSKSWRNNYRSLASVLFHMVLRFDTLLWLTDVYPRHADRDTWWNSLVEHSRAADAFKFNTDFDSKYRIFIVRCIDCLRQLIRQRRPPARDITWLNDMSQKLLSRPLKSGVVPGESSEQMLVEGREASQTGDTGEGRQKPGCGPPKRRGRVQWRPGIVEMETILSFFNVPKLPDDKALAKVQLDRLTWNVVTDEIGSKFNPKYATKYADEACLILAKPSLSVEDCASLLTLGRRIVNFLRPIPYSNPADPSWTNSSRARSFCLLVKQLDTVFRIGLLFPTLTKISDWWPKMVEKCNLRIALQTNIAETSLFFNAIVFSKQALQSLVQQQRPNPVLVSCINQYYERVIQKRREKTEQK